ncbi:hypothetical protein GCM10025770_14360 [Viridibacterium curvum]|uniref:Uncharacterized protein n=1 Tax=Viridibacterium curvum TaxID=1101404 RepID=A0ABP9QJG0_9RHOO
MSAAGESEVKGLCIEARDATVIAQDAVVTGTAPSGAEVVEVADWLPIHSSHVAWAKAAGRESGGICLPLSLWPRIPLRCTRAIC